jgi:hypothetical protein
VRASFELHYQMPFRCSKRYNEMTDKHFYTEVNLGSGEHKDVNVTEALIRIAVKGSNRVHIKSK